MNQVAKSVSTVAVEVSELQSQVQELATALGELGGRLTPVLSLPGPATAEQTTDLPPEHCRLQGELATVNRDIKRAIQHVAFLSSLLQI